MATDYLDYNDIFDWDYDPFTNVEDTIDIGYGSVAAERRTIPSLPPYQIKLYHLPKLFIPSAMEITIVATGVEIIERPATATPANLEFKCQYDEKQRGLLEFNFNQKGLVIDIKYKAVATTVQKDLFESFKNKVLGDIDDKFQDTFLPFTNGIDWVTKNLNTTGFNGVINHIAYDEALNKFVAVGKLTTYLKIWTSENLTDWTEILSVNKGAMTYGFKKVVYSDTLGMWVAVGDYFYYSYNLTDWTEGTRENDYLLYAKDCIWISDLGRFVAVGQTNTGYLATAVKSYCILQSDDGIDWFAVTLPPPTNPVFEHRVLNFIRYDNGYIFTGGDCVTTPQLLISDNGDNWSLIEIGSSHVSHKDGIYSDSFDRYIIVGDNGKIATAEGSNILVWTNRVSGVSTSLRKISKTESTVIIAGDDKTILTSANGTSWTDETLPPLSSLDTWSAKDIIFENDILIIVTDDNRIIYSDDITTFTELSLTPITINLLGIVYINNIFMLYGDSGFIATNGLFFWGLTDSRFSLTETNYNEINSRIITVENSIKTVFSEIIGLSVDSIKNGTDADHDIDIAAGLKCFDSAGVEIMLGTAMTKKLDASFTEGTNQGGLFSGSIAANTTYHLFMIKKFDGTVDYGFDTSLTAANRPAGYTYYRRIWSVITNSSLNIIGFNQVKKHCEWKTKIIDSTSTFTDNNRKTYTLTTPNGIVTKAKIHFSVNNGDGGSYGLFKVESLASVDSAVTSLNYDFVTALAGTGVGENYGFILKDILTNTSKQICARCLDYTANGTGIWSVVLQNLGYEDFLL